MRGLSDAAANETGVHKAIFTKSAKYMTPRDFHGTVGLRVLEDTCPMLIAELCSKETKPRVPFCDIRCSAG